MKTRAVYLITSLLVASMAAFGQTTKEKATPQTNESGKSFASSVTTLERNFKLDKNSKTEEIVIDIPPKATKFDLKVWSSVSNGKLTIEIYDPNGVKLGNYTVGLQAGSEKETSGRINKYFKEPLPGAWKIKIVPVETTGSIWSEVMIYE
ncbi:MAG TPA: hypothetical protein PLM56_07245 [Cyclobacteriaceae bacterium]|jgi:hypothetical protein|nr:hypothetical protein [Cytophagales bacterium]HMR56155.1 hypothetical protein [Cyclobacteriaceae bacterium]HRE66785.1 hypothetical protein [Cyclobacteriaceae bacterium]HRF33277.1 hypothetical protein [Cyclobacteriaceae bacterium]